LFIYLFVINPAHYVYIKMIFLIFFNISCENKMNKDIAKIVLKYLTYDDLQNIKIGYKLDFLENNIDKLYEKCWEKLCLQNLPVSFFEKHIEKIH
jgi:hypothetical protein